MKNLSARWSIAGFFVIVLVSFALHYEQFNKDLIGIHVWRQTQTQWNTLNFYRYDFNIFNPRTAVFDEQGSNIARFEFPLMQWLVALVMKVFGDAIVVTRLCYFIIGCFAVLGMYRLLRLLTKSEVGSLLGALVFCFSPLFFYYTINPLPDNFALCCSIWFLYYIFEYHAAKRRRSLYLSAVFLSLASLAKLPYILFGAVAFLYFLQHIRNRKEVVRIVSVFLLALLPVFAWYAWVIPTWNGNGVLFGVFRNQVSSDRYNEILEYHKRTMFPTVIMNEWSTYLFFIGVLFGLYNSGFRRKIFWLLFAGLLAVVAYWLMELNMIDTVHDYYMMPFLPFLFLVVGYGVISLWRSNLVLKVVAIFFSICAVLNAYNDMRGRWTVESSFTNSDIFYYKDALRKAVPSDALCFIAKDACPFVYTYMFDKMGYWTSDPNYPAGELRKLITNKNVRYMYCDSRGIDSTESVQPLLGKLIMRGGSIKVWELKTVKP